MFPRIVILLWLIAANTIALQAQDLNQPRVSESDPAYLSWTTWNGHAWTPNTPRSARTPVMQSPTGTRAYGEVKVAIKDEFCENSTFLYVAGGLREPFKAVYTKSNGGNGIQLLGWSPDGKELLAQVNSWAYNSDSGYDHVAVVYDALSNSAKEIPELDDALSQHFGTDCEFELAIKGWNKNGQILAMVSKTAPDDSYEQHFCVDQPQAFAFDLKEKLLQSLGSGKTKRR